MPAGSESIFSPSKPQEDVRHDLDAVQKCWSQEKIRRFKRALVIIIPLIALPVIGYVVFSTINPNYSLSRISDPPLPESVYERQEHPEAEPEQPAYKSMGNPEAKLRIEVIPTIANSNLLELLYTAVEAKPSEIYLDMLPESSVPEDELTHMRIVNTCGLKVNGKDICDIQLGKYKTRHVDFNTPFGMAYTAEELCMVISIEHEKIYGKPQTPIFMKIKEIAREVEKTIAAEEKPKKATQSFDFLQTPQETDKND